jgi:hypothetical protein
MVEVVLAFVVAIGAGIVANKLTPLVPDLVKERREPPPLACPIRNPQKVGRRDFGVRYQDELWIVTQHEHAVVKAATSGFLTTLPPTQWFVEFRVKHSAEWETGYIFHGQQKRKLNFISRDEPLGRFLKDGRTLAFILFFRGTPVDPLPYFPELQPLEQDAPSWKTTPDQARMVLQALATRGTTPSPLSH